MSVWNPYFKKEINQLKGFQRRATKLTNKLKILPHEVRMRKQNLKTLDKKGIEVGMAGRLILVDLIFEKNLVPHHTNVLGLC